jgi:hypothetical protein
MCTNEIGELADALACEAHRLIVVCQHQFDFRLKAPI